MASTYRCVTPGRVLDPGVANATRLNVTVTTDMADVAAHLWSVVEGLPANTSKEVGENTSKKFRDAVL